MATGRRRTTLTFHTEGSLEVGSTLTLATDTLATVQTLRVPQTHVPDYLTALTWRGTHTHRFRGER